MMTYAFIFQATYFITAWDIMTEERKKVLFAKISKYAIITSILLVNCNGRSLVQKFHQIQKKRLRNAK